MYIKQLPNPRERLQCQLPKEQLNPATLGYKGYREKRTKLNGFSVDQCMRVATWQVGDKLMCTQHAGIHVLQYFETKEETNAEVSNT